MRSFVKATSSSCLTRFTTDAHLFTRLSKRALLVSVQAVAQHDGLLLPLGEAREGACDLMGQLVSLRVCQQHLFRSWSVRIRDDISQGGTLIVGADVLIKTDCSKLDTPLPDHETIERKLECGVTGANHLLTFTIGPDLST